MEILEFIFQDFWHWVGALILIVAPIAVVVTIFHKD